MLKSEILEGITMKECISMPTSSDVGVSLIGDSTSIPLTSSVLSKHLLYTGTIGTGKTTAMFQLLRQVELMLVFMHLVQLCTSTHKRI